MREKCTHKQWASIYSILIMNKVGKVLVPGYLTQLDWSTKHAFLVPQVGLAITPDQDPSSGQKSRSGTCMLLIHSVASTRL